MHCTQREAQSSLCFLWCPSETEHLGPLICKRWPSLDKQSCSYSDSRQSEIYRGLSHTGLAIEFFAWSSRCWAGWKLRGLCLLLASAVTAAAKLLQSCLTSVRPHRRQLTRLPHPWDSPGKNTGVGCHFLLQCMKVKSQSEVAQSCPTSSERMNCSLPGSSIHGIFQARVLEWVAIAFSK